MKLGTYRTFILVVGDLALLWLGLLLTLFIRHGIAQFEKALLPLHIIPFSIVFGLWIVIFYIAGLYDVRASRTYERMLKLISPAMLTGAVIAIMLFYFVPAFTITPRTNLLMDVVISFFLLLGWRAFFIFANSKTSKIRVMLLGRSPDIAEIERTIRSFPEFGYHIVARFETIPEDIARRITPHAVDIVVAPKEAQSHVALVHVLYESLHSRIRFVDATQFYEQILGKIPVSLISKMWFLENIAETEKIFFEGAKRSIDVVSAVVGGIVTLAIFPLVVLAIKLDSKGPIFIKQKRVGKLGKVFTLYKYRTMIALGPDGLAEENGAQWSQKGDARVTRVGKILR